MRIYYIVLYLSCYSSCSFPSVLQLSCCSSCFTRIENAVLSRGTSHFAKHKEKTIANQKCLENVKTSNNVKIIKNLKSKKRFYYFCKTQRNAIEKALTSCQRTFFKHFTIIFHSLLFFFVFYKKCEVPLERPLSASCSRRDHFFLALAVVRQG